MIIIIVSCIIFLNSVLQPSEPQSHELWSSPHTTKLIRFLWIWLFCQHQTDPFRTITLTNTTVPFFHLVSSSCFSPLVDVFPLLSLPDGLTAVRKLTADIRASVCSRRFSDEKATCWKHETPYDKKWLTSVRVGQTCKSTQWNIRTS